MATSGRKHEEFNPATKVDIATLVELARKATNDSHDEVPSEGIHKLMQRIGNISTMGDLKFQVSAICAEQNNQFAAKAMVNKLFDQMCGAMGMENPNSLGRYAS